MTNTHILGDNVPRKSNFDPDLARKVTEYYAKHPEELAEKPQVPAEPTDINEQQDRKYILMPQTPTYALGLNALQEECITENNQVHPHLTGFGESLIYRPLSFKENIQARVENYETTHNPDGRERTLEERLFFIMERQNNSCTAIVYKAGTTKFKVVPISEHLITLDPDFKEDFIRAKYSNIPGTELDSEKGRYSEIMEKKDVLNHPGWLAAVEEDKALLNSYVNIIFTELEKYHRTAGMGFWVSQYIVTDELRALLVCHLISKSIADGSRNLNYGGSFLRRNPSLGVTK